MMLRYMSVPTFKDLTIELDVTWQNKQKSILTKFAYFLKLKGLD